MDFLKKIKVELWVLCLAGLLSLLLAVGTGILVRQELVGKIKLGVVSKSALFLAEIPVNLKEIWGGDSPSLITEEQRFANISGFQGKPLEEETYLLLSRYDGNIKRSVVELVDLRSFEVKKTWRPDIDQINGLVDTSHREFKHIKRDRHATRYRIHHPFLTEDGGLIFQNETPLVKIDKNSKLVWQNQEDTFHHSVEQDHEGNLWVPIHAYPYQIDKKYVGTKFGTYYDDAITKISPEGKILFQKSVSEIFIEHDLRYLLFSANKFSPRDPIHLNDIQPVLTDGPYWKRGDVFLSLRHQSMIILYRPSTNKIIWKGVGHTLLQHDVDILDDHRISIFNNNAYFFDDYKVDGNNQIIIYDFETDSYSKYFDELLKGNDVRTKAEGRGQILDNGDLFIEETQYGRTLYFNKNKSLQWQHVNRADGGNVYLVGWSRILYKPEDIKKVRKIIKTGN